MQAAAVAVVVAVLWTAPAVRAASASPSPGAAPGGAGDQVVLLGRVLVARGQSVGEVVVFSGRVAVAGVVRGDVVVLDGPVTVSGQVSGTVIALGGSVTLLAGAQVAGDVIARERVTLAQGVLVGGRVREDVAFNLSGPLRAVGAFLSWLAVAVSTLVLGLLFALVAPRGMDAVARAGRAAPFASAGWALGLAIGLPVLAVAAIALVVGLPLGLAVLLALALIGMLGAVVTAHTVGRLLTGDERGTAVAFLAGWGVAAVVGVVPFVSGAVFVLSSVFGAGEIAMALRRARTPSRSGRHRVGSVTSSNPR